VAGRFNKTAGTVAGRFNKTVGTVADRFDLVNYGG
jgi:hypothetical protein